MSLHRALVPLLLLSTAVTAGCDGDDPGEVSPVESAFTLDIDGAITERASGRAYFGSDEDANSQPIFAILLGDDTSRHLVIAAVPGASRPGPGSYTIIDPESSQAGWELLHMVSEDDELLAMFIATTGTLTITESEDDVVRGSLEYDASGFFGTAEDSVAVTAEFVAVPADGAGPGIAMQTTALIRGVR